MNKRVPTETVIDILKNYKDYIEPQKEESLELAYAIQRGIESLKQGNRSKWISIDKRLPTGKDADIDGLILIKYSRGAIREASWGSVADANLLDQNVKYADDSRGWVISWARMPEVEDP